MIWLYISPPSRRSIGAGVSNCGSAKMISLNWCNGTTSFFAGRTPVNFFHYIHVKAEIGRFKRVISWYNFNIHVWIDAREVCFHKNFGHTKIMWSWLHKTHLLMLITFVLRLSLGFWPWISSFSMIWELASMVWSRNWRNSMRSSALGKELGLPNFCSVSKWLKFVGFPAKREKQARRLLYSFCHSRRHFFFQHWTKFTITTLFIG